MADVEIVQDPAPVGASIGDALVLPGRRYTIDHPILAWTQRMLRERGWACTSARWTVDDLDPEDAAPFVADVAASLYARRRTGGPTIVVAKSLGTLSMGWARDLALPAAWLTPLLHRPDARALLDGYPAPTLLVGGTADPLWDPVVAARSGAQVLEVPGADHSLLLPSSWEESHAVERTVVRAVAELADRATA
jgi:hypothetical protein